MDVQALLGADWDDLRQEDLERFLDTAEDEGLTWEVKGDRKSSTWPRPVQVYEPTCAFGNSVDGGVLIIGAERRLDDRGKAVTGWDLRGLQPPNEEIPLWLARQCARVRPEPQHSPPKVWEVGASRRAAALLIEPVAVPPCVTPDGRVLQRTSGASIPVSDPAVLAELQQRGRAARERASDNAETVGLYAEDLPGKLPTPVRWPDNPGYLTVAVAAVGYPPDIGGRLFHEQFLQQLQATAAQLPITRDRPPHSDSSYVRRLVGQGHVAMRFDPRFQDDFSHHWGVVAHWSGAVAVTSSPYQDGGWGVLREDVLVPAWRVASELVSALGGAGARYSFVRAEPPRPPRPRMVTTISAPPDPVFGRGPTARWIDGPGPTDGDIDYVLAELRRGAGEDVWLSAAPDE